MAATDVKIGESWKGPLSAEFSSPYMASLRSFLVHEKEAGKRIFPRGAEYFRALGEGHGAQRWSTRFARIGKRRGDIDARGRGARQFVSRHRIDERRAVIASFDPAAAYITR